MAYQHKPSMQVCKGEMTVGTGKGRERGCRGGGMHKKKGQRGGETVFFWGGGRGTGDGEGLTTYPEDPE